MRRIKIAQIGTNPRSHGNCIFNALKKNSDVFEIVGVCFPENEREKFPYSMPDYEGFRELTLEEIMENPEIEAVAIETEEVHLTKYAQMAANHKKHIHMEKPGGINFSDFEKLIETVRENKTVFHIGYMYRYNPYIMELKEQIKAGELGEILSVEAQMSCIHPKDTRQWLGNFPGGMMFFLGCHLIDIILSIQGEPEKIIPLNKASGLDGVESIDSGMVVFEYKNGVSFAKTTAVEIGGFERRQLVVTGSQRCVELNPLEWYIDGKNLVTQRVTRENPDWNAAGIKEVSAPLDRYDGMMRAFAKKVSEKAITDYDYELLLYKTLLDACK